mmetsp:Transcript_29689/g.84963  ORF Transcript_29689/g.84963 Transcript_29689/m.84963 type:complete len:321 (-) Transcript_29689:454-1416(-)
MLVQSEVRLQQGQAPLDLYRQRIQPPGRGLLRQQPRRRPGRWLAGCRSRSADELEVACGAATAETQPPAEEDAAARQLPHELVPLLLRQAATEHWALGALAPSCQSGSAARPRRVCDALLGHSSGTEAQLEVGEAVDGVLEEGQRQELGRPCLPHAVAPRRVLGQREEQQRQRLVGAERLCQEVLLEERDGGTQGLCVDHALGVSAAECEPLVVLERQGSGPMRLHCVRTGCGHVQATDACQADACGGAHAGIRGRKQRGQSCLKGCQGHRVVGQQHKQLGTGVIGQRGLEQHHLRGHQLTPASCHTWDNPPCTGQGEQG